MILPIFISIYFVVSFISPKSFENSASEIEFWNRRGNFVNSTAVSLEVLSADISNFELHYEFLANYCKLKKRGRDLISGKVTDVLGDIEEYYHKLSQSTGDEFRIGFYGYWKLKTYLDRSESKFKTFLEADTIQINAPYINELKGDIFSKYDIKSSITYYEKELKVNPENKNAKIKLFKLVFYKGDSKIVEKLLKVEDILNEPSLYKYIRYYYFKHDIKKWLAVIPAQYIYSGDSLVILNAIFIFIVWMVFLFYINVFKEIKKSILFLCGILSVISIPLVISLYDAYYFTQTDYVENIFWDNFIVGLFEETTKIIFPLLIASFFASKLKSPFSVMILFSLSSLIFAMFENMLYFGNYFDLSIVSVRGIYSVTMHLCAGTVAAYGYILYEFRGKSLFYFLFTFILAVIIHMMYDVIAGSFVYLLNVPFVIISVYILVSIYNNILNNSPEFNHEKETKLNYSGLVLISGLSAVLLFEFVSVSFRYGFQIGHITFMESLLSYGWLILVFASPVSNFKLVKDKWSFIDLGGMKSFDNLSNEIKEIEVTPIGLNASSYRLKILGTIRANSEKKWFHCLQENTGEYYLVNFKEDGDHLIDSKIILYVLKAEKEVSHAFNAKSYPYLGMVFSSPVFNS